jgi:hypothetical protein
MTAVEQQSGVLATELRLLARKGLPLGPGDGWPRLLALAATAGGVEGGTSARTEALDGALRRALARLEPERSREAAKALFGLPPARPGLTLTRRREVAAGVLGREVHHFRKRMEPRILAAVAYTLEREAAARTRPWATPPPVRPSPARRCLPKDVFAWEAAEHEETLTRLWACVYTLRAELLAVERQVSLGDLGGATASADAALWRYGQLQAQVRRYRAAYGGVLLPDGQASPQDLVALAGWTPHLSATENALVTDASSAAGVRLFTSNVHAAAGGANLLAVWRTALTASEKESVG